MSTSFIFQLPEALCVELLSEWCEVRYLALLEIAVVSAVKTNVHPHLLEIFKHPGFITSTNYDCFIPWLIRNEIKLSSLKLCDGVNTKLISLSDFMKCLEISQSTLGHLTISDYDLDLTDELLSGFINTCPNLISLHLGHLNTITEELFDLINKSSLENFQELRLDHCEKIKANFIKVIAETCMKLEILLFVGGPVIPEMPSDYDSLFLSLLQINNELRFLVFVDAYVSMPDILQEIIKNCPKMEVLMLDISMDFDISMTDFTHLVEECKSLNSVSIERINGTPYCRYNSVDKLVYFGHANNDVPDFSNEKLEFFSKNRNFTYIDLATLTKDTNEIVSLIAENNPNLKYFALCIPATTEINPNLGPIHINQSQDINTPAPSEAQLSTAVLNKLLTKCKQLKHIALYGINDISNDDLIRLFTAPENNHIEQITIGQHFELDSATVATILKTCYPKLKKFRMFNCFQFNIQKLNALTKGLKFPKDLWEMQLIGDNEPEYVNPEPSAADE